MTTMAKKKWSPDQVEALIARIHHTPEDLEAPEDSEDSEDCPDLLERIHAWDHYEEATVSLRALQLNEWAIMEEHVGALVRVYENDLLAGEYPPLVIAPTGESWTLIDGIHRANALHRLGVEHVRVLIGQGNFRAEA